MNTKFKLTDSFLDRYKKVKPPFGFGVLGELVYLRTYSRIKEDGKNEMWYETVARVVEGTFNMQKSWIEEHQLGWNSKKAQASAQQMFERIFTMKFLPPGRGLWAMGSPITEERNLFAALNNCAFVSTENLKEDLAKSFCFLMDASMLGVGCGFDCKGAGKVFIKGCNKKQNIKYEIPDDRLGWVESVRLLIDSYFLNSPNVTYDYSKIRKAGELIKGFGGVSGGYEILEECHGLLKEVLDKNVDSDITITTIVDIMNIIGRCVVSANIRRSAEIAFGEPLTEEFLNLKDYKINKEREKWGWASNNSVFAELGMNYNNVANRTKGNGEPGYTWLENMRGYSRMNNGMDNKDVRACGANPCAEQTLESYELCCLVETFPDKHESLEDFITTLKYAYLYAKTVTLGKTHWPETNRVMLRNRRIGCSMSGIQQFVVHKGLHVLKEWCEEGYKAIERYDKTYSDWLAIPQSIKKTSIKPSGSVSNLAGATSGMHWPESRYYLRRIRLAKNSELVKPLIEAGYNVEPCSSQPEVTVVVSIPVDIGEGIRPVSEVSMWEQVSMAAFLQKYWADNQVSCTVSFQPEEANEIEHSLNYFQYQLKGISFLPQKQEKPYKQMPFEKISEEQYNKEIKELKNVKFRNISNELANVERFCSNDSCEIK